MSQWFEDIDPALFAREIPVPGTTRALRVTPIRNLMPAEVDELRALMLRAYAYSKMQTFFNMNVMERRRVLVFTCRDADGKLIGTRSIGEVAWGGMYWSAHAAAIGQEAPISGANLTVARRFRGGGLGKRIMAASTEWVRRHTSAKAIFGNTYGVSALRMYLSMGAWALDSDIEELCAAYSVPDVQTFLAEDRGIARLPTRLNIRYVWPLTEDVKEKLMTCGYKP